MIQWKRGYNPSEWGTPIILAGADEIAELKATSGMVTFSGGECPVDFLYEYVGSDTTFVSFHAALSVGTEELPVFTGRSISEGLGVNRVFFSDPSLIMDSDLTLGWFLGTKSLDYPEIAYSTIRALQERFGGQNLVFFGSSGGGFASLKIAHRFPESLAICVNPQTKVTDYGQVFWERYARLCHDAVDEVDARRILDGRLGADVRSLYAQGMSNYVLYLQNAFDSHVRLHMLPFIESVASPERVGALFGWNWGQGHRPPPAQVLRQVLRHSGRVWGDWNRLFELAEAHVAPTRRDILSVLSRAKKEIDAQQE
ncbi:hypothetical protein [Brevibacterium paucivorans]|uniref:Alpha/beta hydrolase n=1 Tax=Brevibacterium paucivorans TaxID=170994 RepID=A0A2N6VR91_9MICO|nr:hypothetical protein [Brevibacterium paucivorans]PMD06627.1 hypothetical protein CJ199_04555 [Brevibacterium paucivorans]